MGAHGVRGDVRVKSFTAVPENVFAYGPLLDGKGGVLIETKAFRPAKDHFIVTPKSPQSREAWQALKGTQLYVPRALMPPAEAEEYYVEDLIGLAVHVGGAEPVGHVRGVQDFGAGELLDIEPTSGGKSVLIPFTREDVPTVDLEGGRIIVASWDLWRES